MCVCWVCVCLYIWVYICLFIYVKIFIRKYLITWKYISQIWQLIYSLMALQKNVKWPLSESAT